MQPPRLPLKAIQILEQIEDPRRRQARRHPLVSIMAVVFCGLAMGEEGWDGMAAMAGMCWDWFRSIVPCAEQAPSADTLRRVVSSIKPAAFQDYFQQWCTALNLGQSDLLHADGKKIRGSTGGYVVTLFSEGENLSFGQQSVEEGGEKAALGKLLNSLELQGTTVTLDAGFCSREMAKQILDTGASYVMAVKGNQPELFREIEELIERQLKAGHFHMPCVKLDEAHGRCETRRAYILNDPSLIDLETPFPGIKTIGWIDSETYRSRDAIDQGTCTTSRRVYIASEHLTPQQIQEYVRGHWSIENKLHWVLDVVFKEDGCQVRTRTAAENLTWMRKLLIHALKRLFPKLSFPLAQRSMRYSDTARLRLLQLLGGVS